MKRTRIILLVEDDPADQAIVRRALEQSSSETRLEVTSDGAEALDYLYRRNAYADSNEAPLPDLLLVDLNMPRMDGREVIRALRGDPAFATVPIVALTTSNDERDIRGVYALGANSYVVKPAGIDELCHVMDTLLQYWFDVVELPPAA